MTEYSAERNEAALASLLKTDAGSKRIDEVAIGMNDGIDRATKNISFDEKMGAIVYLALGRTYENTVGEGQERNQNALQADLIMYMSEDRLELDGDVVQRDGQFAWE